MTAEIAVVGDVHGDADRLSTALDTLPRLADRIIFVGDYVNRGPQSRDVLDRLVSARDVLGDRLCLLRGNHDEALLTFLASGHLGRFAMLGGLQTIRSYLRPSSSDVVADFRNAFPEDHLRLLSTTRLWFERDDLLVSHCGFDPQRPSMRHMTTMVTGNFPDLFREPWISLGKLVVCGHYVQRRRRPFMRDDFICVDTGCGIEPGAPLTAVILPVREIISF